MPIASKSVRKNRPLKYSYDIELEYVFDDGTKKIIKCRGPLQSSASAYLVAKESQVLESKINHDAEEAMLTDSDAPNGDADQVQVYRAWMTRGYLSDNPIESYVYLSKVAEKVIALGLSPTQLSAMFGYPIETINDVLSKWQYLKTNKTAILAYKTIKDGM